LYDGPFEPPLYRIRRAPPDKILALKASRAAALSRCARRKFDIAMERAGRSVKKSDRSGRRMVESEDDDSEVRVDSRRVSEILAAYRREFEVLDPDERERFLDAVRLFAAGRMRLREWLAIARAARERYEAMLPAPIPPGRAIKAKIVPAFRRRAGDKSSARQNAKRLSF
jgi:hypothetical protein